MGRAMRARRSLRIIGATCGTLLLGAGGGVCFAFLKASSIATHAAQQALPSLSRQLGFDIRYARIDANAWPNPSVVVSNLVIGRVGEPPVLTAGTVRASVALWPLVRSLGTSIQLRAVVIDDARLSCTRQTDGTYDLLSLTEGLLRLQTGSAAQVRVDRFTVNAKSLELRELQRGAAVLGAIGAVTAEIDLVGAQQEAPARPLAAPPRAHVRSRAAVGSDAPNVSIELDLALAQTGASATGRGPDIRGSIAVDGLDLARNRWLVPAALEEVAGDGVLSAKLSITSGDGGVVSAAGPVTIERISLLDQPATLTCSMESRLHTKDAAELELRLPSISVDRVSMAKAALQAVRAQGAMDGRSFRAEQAVGTFCGAPVSIGQATFAPGTTWALAGRIEGLSLAEFARATAVPLPLSGSLTARFETTGTGKSWDVIRSHLGGAGRFDIDHAQLDQVVISALMRPIQSALGSAGVPSALVADWLKPPTSMAVEPFGAAFRIVDGQVRLVDAVSLRTSMWDVVLTGQVGLDETLALSGRAIPHHIGGAKPAAPAAPPSTGKGLPVSIRGTLSDPRVEVSATPAEIAGVVVDAIPTPRDIQDGALLQIRDWLRRR